MPRFTAITTLNLGKQTSRSGVAETLHLTDDDISFVCRLIEQAGKLAKEMRQGVEIREKSGPQDLVTEADCELSRIITTSLKNRFFNDVIISEEDIKQQVYNANNRVWLVDPIDGTDNYIKNDGQYSVMVGLVVSGTPLFGWVYAPTIETLYFGGPKFGTFVQRGSGAQDKCTPVAELDRTRPTRLMIGFRDRRSHPWVNELPGIELVKAGSIGIKVAKILEDEADIFVHLSGKLKVWDTAGPVAIALGAGLEVGQLESNYLPFHLPQVEQNCSVVIGRRGSLFWSSTNLRQQECQ